MSPFDMSAKEMRPYLKKHFDKEGKPHQITRHMMGLFHGFAWSKDLEGIFI